MATLQQSVATCPFVGHLILFRLVTSWAGYDNIFGAIRATARQWHNMIHMVGFANFYAAVVTFSFLPLVLSLNVIAAIVALGSGFSCATTVVLGPGRFNVILSPSSVLGRYSLFVPRGPFSFSFSRRLYIASSNVSLPLQKPIAVVSAIFKPSCRYLFAMLLVVTAHIFGVLGFILLSIFASPQQSFIAVDKVLRVYAIFVSRVVPTQAFQNSFAIIGIVFESAKLARGVQLARATIVVKEILACCRENLTALGTLFRGWGFWGMILHTKPPVRFRHVPGRYKRRWDNYFSPSILPHLHWSAQ